MKRLTINGQLADIAELPSAISFKYVDIIDGLDKRAHPFSSGITLPYTARNKSIFKYADVVGGDLSGARGVSNVDLFYGGIKVIEQGSLTLDSMDVDGYHCTINSRNTLIDSIEALKVEDVMDEIQGDADIFNSYTYNYLLPSLASGTFGVMLARDLLDDITSAEWIIFQKMISGEENINHWLWFSLLKLFTTLETMVGFKFYFAENGQLVDLSNSTIVDTYFPKLWTPGYPYYLQIDPGTGICTMGKNISDTVQFYFGTGNGVPRSSFRVFGDKTAWEMVKIVSNMFCCGLKVSAKDGKVIFYPLDEIKNFDSIDLSGRLTERPEKIPFVEGYTSTSRIRFTVSDNAPEDYNEIVLTSPKLPTEESDLYTLELLVPGIYYNTILNDNVFKMNMSDNDMINTVPVVLYQNNETALTSVRYSHTAGNWLEYGVYLEKLRMLDLSAFHGELQAWITKGLVYNIKIAISVYDYMKLQPYRFVRIKELGGDFYLNKIDKWNPDKEAKMQLIKADSGVVKTMPVLTWNDPANITYGAPLSATELNCSADVAGTFNYLPALGEVLNAGTHSLSVTFVPTDPEAYNIATKTVNITVDKATATVTWATPSAITYGTALYGAQLNATANIPGSFVYDPPAGTVLNAGTNNLDVTFTPFDTVNYTGDTENVDLVVNKATPAITWADPSAITYGTPLSSTQLNATANTPGVFTYNPTSGATLNAGTNTLNVSFVPTDTANWNNASDTASLVVNKATPSITWNPLLTRILDGEQWQSGHLNATGSVGGTITYNYAIGGGAVAVGDVLDISEGTTTIWLYATLTPTDSTNYNPYTIPSPGKMFNTVAPYLSFDDTIDQQNGLIEFFTPGTYNQDIALYSSVAYQITSSGGGFTIKIYNSPITFPYNGTAGNLYINVSGSFNQVDRTQTLTITPESGSGLNPITLTCKYYKDEPL